jgi:myo-inositol-1(or 4)-monophosphatase
VSVTDELGLAIDAARRAGETLRRTFGGEQTVTYRDARDVKLAADVAAEEQILGALAPTGLPVLAEESGVHGTLEKAGRFWVVDPLDGTMNYHRGTPGCCVSIALCDGGEPVLGVVYDFVLDELFAGAVGHGVTLNGRPVRVSEVTEPGRGVLATGFPKHFEDTEAARGAMFDAMRRFMKVRMIGSSALAIAYVACGRFDAYSEDRSMLWDFAGGVALVRAAGGEARFDALGRWVYQVRCVAQRELWGAFEK